ncbi:beta-ketoacyl synthase chain length factor [Fulvimonas soli]|jgi:hypothetical protein|uniref:Beta-ketoacyl synthase-like protein n=1 Tax=Fulvimonas soli TaxID=155197 RepID=A0A316IIL4_9GAMM|nr:beta-ketoacyl synthase chain length factor [Fulvimonas soli]PWK92354.1 beta-ketoacyl synthase-like protein [Fulvimonas soli]TNY25942.1 hypothetical protein BV497_11460 [Fulvimonas soli]
MSAAVHVAGVGLWAEGLPGFDALRARLAGAPAADTPGRPPAALLPPNERRRAPPQVLLAVEAAGQALAMSGLAPDAPACVFASAYGDQATTDYLCATLARAPRELSPTRFHQSVHNAAAGYWTIATGCRAPSSALCAGPESFGAGLLEAVLQVLADDRPVLLVACDTPGQGPLAEMTACHDAFACALLLAPRADGALARLSLHPHHGPCASLPWPEAFPADWLGGNPSAGALPLLVQLASGSGRCRLPAAPRLGLDIHVESPA